jgi:hypothetical protein
MWLKNPCLRKRIVASSENITIWFGARSRSVDSFTMLSVSIQALVLGCQLPNKKKKRIIFSGMFVLLLIS